jgi:hypothetical protein
MATIWVDMERGTYDWGERSVPKNGDGSFRVVKQQILRDMRLTTDYHDQKRRLWENPKFKQALTAERLRRDHGLLEVAEEMEAKGAPISGISRRIVEMIQERLDGDPEELSTKDLLQLGPQWVRLGLELDGKVAADHRQKIELVLQKTENKLDPEMLADVVDRIREYNDEKQKRLGLLIEGEVEEP